MSAFTQTFKITLHCVFGLLPLFAQDQAQPLETYRLLYEDSLQRVEKNHNEGVLDLSMRYTERLNGVKAFYQKQGNLTGVLLVETEQEAIKRFETLPVITEGEFTELSSVRSIYTGALAVLVEDRNSKVANLQNVYLTHLKSMTSKLTRENRIDEALAVRDEVQRIESGSNFEIMQESQDVETSIPEEKLFEIFWGSPVIAEHLLIRSKGLQRKPDLQLNGTVNLKPEGLIFKEGRVRVNGVGEEFSTAVRETGQFSFQVKITPTIAEQFGPARIIGCSKGSEQRNFTLGQQEDQLVLRLRTSHTNENGTQPELSLGPVKEGVPTTVVFSYRENEVLCYRDGKAVDVEEITGDFSTWERMPLVLGNEIQAQRLWTGAFHNFKLSNKALSPEEAEAASK